MSKDIAQTKHINLAYEMFKNIQGDDFEYIYRGYFSQTITDNILSLTEVNLKREEEAIRVKKRIFVIMVECLQNITRHQEVESDEQLESGIFVILKKKYKYIITSGNPIITSRIDNLKQQLELINSMNKEELKSYYKVMLTQGKISDKGGAGLGLIEMARKSGEKLLFNFKKINDEFSYFYLTTEVPFSSEAIKLDENFSLDEVVKYHNELIEENVILNFKGAFNQDNLLSLLSIIEKQMQHSEFSIKAFNIMVEMLQNIVKHADNITNDSEGNFGIFLLSENPNGYLLTAGNYVQKNKIEILKNKIEFVNALSIDELDDFYDATLLNMEIDDNKRSGLGIIDMRLKSEEQFNFHFHEVTDDYAFFTIQSRVSKLTSTMESLILDATVDTPEIIINPQNGIYKITGRSLPENALAFYKQIIEWFEKYCDAPNQQTEFIFKLDYFNTASQKQIMKLLLTLEKIALKSEVLVNWHYRAQDSDMLNIGLRFKKLLKLNFELTELK